MNPFGPAEHERAVVPRTPHRHHQGYMVAANAPIPFTGPAHGPEMHPWSGPHMTPRPMTQATSRPMTQATARSQAFPPAMHMPPPGHFIGHNRPGHPVPPPMLPYPNGHAPGPMQPYIMPGAPHVAHAPPMPHPAPLPAPLPLPALPAPSMMLAPQTNEQSVHPKVMSHLESLADAVAEGRRKMAELDETVVQRDEVLNIRERLHQLEQMCHNQKQVIEEWKLSFSVVQQHNRVLLKQHNKLLTVVDSLRRTQDRLAVVEKAKALEVPSETRRHLEVDKDTISSPTRLLFSSDSDLQKDMGRGSSQEGLVYFNPPEDMMDPYSGPKPSGFASLIRIMEELAVN